MTGYTALACLPLSRPHTDVMHQGPHRNRHSLIRQVIVDIGITLVIVVTIVVVVVRVVRKAK
jgi:hypothetical protein